jgi:NADPH:quinone reductase-like Zn-dependent oxidoreductase
MSPDDQSSNTAGQGDAGSGAMRAVQVMRFGGPDGLAEAMVPIPQLPADSVMVRVSATSVNPIDLVARRGLLRIMTGFRLPLGTGVDFAGEISEIGEEVTRYAIGDRVWGYLRPSRRSTSAAAEFLVAQENTVSLAPATISLVDAAALPLAASTALVALRDHLQLGAGQRLLVRGAAGGVGSAAVQLGKAMGAHVTALVSARDGDFVRQLGADVALDYRTHSPAQLGVFDAIFDLKGSALLSYRRLLSPAGRIVSAAAGGFIWGAVTRAWGSRRVRSLAVSSRTDDLASISKHVDEGQLRPIIDTVRPLAEMADAHRALEAGGTRGKQVVSIR